MKAPRVALLGFIVFVGSSLGAVPDTIRVALEQDLPRLQGLYHELHQNPELTLLEEKTAARVANELRQAGFEVSDHVGGFGVVGVLKNGPGPVVLVRTDLDALPVKE